jgi:diguanylate cyclase (GGDEF)-like protein
MTAKTSEAQPRTRGNASNRVFAPVSFRWSELADLTFPWRHDPHVRRHRSAVVASRIQLVSAIFAVLVPLWLAVDVLVFPRAVWLAIVPLRLGATLVFVILAWPRPTGQSPLTATLMLTAMLMVPPVFHLLIAPILAGAGASSFELLMRALYDHLPFTVVAGLSVFPLTAFEVGLFWLMVLGTMILGMRHDEAMDLHALVGSIWLLVLIGGTAMISGMSQLQYMIALVRRVTFDPLTGCLSRRAGLEVLEQQFQQAQHRQAALSLAFIDLDRFKAINDGFGHEMGDLALQSLGQRLRTAVHGPAEIVRWGGEEFLLVLPGTGPDAARTLVHHLGRAGFGERPDGTLLTVSIGIAERVADRVTAIADLIDLADRRMYAAKRAGRNRVAFDDQGSIESLVPDREAPAPSLSFPA